MALRFVLERTVKIKAGYVNPKLGFWFASSTFKPQLCSSLPSTDCCKNGDSTASLCDHYPRFGDIIVPRLGSRHPLAGGSAIYDKPLDHPEILRIARTAVKQYNRQQNTQLEFVRLLKAYTQCSVGTLFCLTLEAIDAGVKKTYFAEILRNASKNCRLELESFQLVPNKIET
ncbi:hypothetical protein ACSBR2_028894 [Camellia fascicularis]